MATRDVKMSPPGLAQRDFHCIGHDGLGDQLNAYPHSMAWFNDRLYVGTTRSNLCLFKVSRIKKNVDIWPVECPDYVYSQDMRAQIWRWDPTQESRDKNVGWEMCYQSTHITTDEGEVLPKSIGYRGMCVYQGKSDDFPHLYVSSFVPARGQGTRIMRSPDGENFEEVKLPDVFDHTITTLRLMIEFKGKMYTSPTGRVGGNPNASGLAHVYCTDDPVNGEWEMANIPAFGDPNNLGVFEMEVCGDWLYAGTGNLNGYQIWRTRAEGEAPFVWERVVTEGAYRGPLNQGVASFVVHNGTLYAGGGIQHGGIDVHNAVGPAGPELIRIHENGEWDLIVGRERATPDGMKIPLSGYAPGFGSPFNGYFWRMASHDGWMYLGTFDWSVMLRYADQSKWPTPFVKMCERYGLEEVIKMQGGAELFRSRDGENWMPVTRNGFNNPCNYGIRTFQSTPYGLAVGFVNPFGPRIGGWENGEFVYTDNPNGGMEIWFGDTSGG